MLNCTGIKITVIGDGVVGKTCMLTTYVSGNFPELYEPTIFDHHGMNILVDGEESQVVLWDTAGQEDFQNLRKLVCPGVATKTDLRDDPSVLCKTPKEGQKLAQKVGAKRYLECSSLRCEGLDEIFTEAVRLHRINQKKANNNQCCGFF